MTSPLSLWSNRRRTIGAVLLVSGLGVLGLWHFMGTIVPIVLLVAAVVLAWRRSAVGVAVAVVAAAVLFFFGLTLAWVFVAVGAALALGGIAVLVIGGGKQIEGKEG